MFPNLVELGPIVIKSLNVFFALGFVAGMFVYWRKGKEEHYDEMMLFDGLLLSQLVGVLVSRVFFISTHFQQFGFDFVAWVDIFSNSGFSLFVFYLVSGLYLYRFAIKKKWDAFEILDFWILGVTLSLLLIWTGHFLAGTAFGIPTTLPWGMVFPGVFDKHHPVQLYNIVFYLLLFAYLSWVEYRYRTFSWYRAGKNTAKTGFLVSTFLIMTGLFSLMMSLVSVSGLVIRDVSLDIVVSLLLTVVGVVMLIARSGKQWPFQKKRQRLNRLEDFSV